MTSERIQANKDAMLAFDIVRQIPVEGLHLHMWADEDGDLNLNDTFDFQVDREKDANKLNIVLDRVEKLKTMNCNFKCSVSFDDDGYIFFTYYFGFEYGHAWNENSVTITVMIVTK